jgi:hypothetical protein
MAVVSRDSNLSNGFDSQPLPLQGGKLKTLLDIGGGIPAKRVSFGSGSAQGAQTTVRDSHDQHN